MSQGRRIGFGLVESIASDDGLKEMNKIRLLQNLVAQSLRFVAANRKAVAGFHETTKHFPSAGKNAVRGRGKFKITATELVDMWSRSLGVYRQGVADQMRSSPTTPNSVDFLAKRIKPLFSAH